MIHIYHIYDLKKLGLVSCLLHSCLLPGWTTFWITFVLCYMIYCIISYNITHWSAACYIAALNNLCDTYYQIYNTLYQIYDTSYHIYDLKKVGLVSCLLHRCLLPGWKNFWITFVLCYDIVSYLCIICVIQPISCYWSAACYIAACDIAAWRNNQLLFFNNICDTTYMIQFLGLVSCLLHSCLNNLCDTPSINSMIHPAKSMIHTFILWYNIFI